MVAASAGHSAVTQSLSGGQPGRSRRGVSASDELDSCCPPHPQEPSRHGERPAHTDWAGVIVCPSPRLWARRSLGMVRWVGQVGRVG